MMELRQRQAAWPQTVCLLVLLSALPARSNQKVSHVRGDDSDWWSNVTEVGAMDFSAPQTNTQHRELGSSTLEILTIKVGLGEIDRAATKLGKTPVVMRGDAASSRLQACYVSPDSDTHLIFQEDGEGFGAAFYLFEDGPNWNGSNLCARSPLVSQSIATASGLRLGMTRTQVEDVLGKPSNASSGQLRYVFEVRKRTSANELKRLRAQNPNLSDEDFHESFDYYYVSCFVVAKFHASKLNYLAVTRSESYP